MPQCLLVFSRYIDRPIIININAKLNISEVLDPVFGKFPLTGLLILLITPGALVVDTCVSPIPFGTVVDVDTAVVVVSLGSLGSNGVPNTASAPEVATN